MALMGAKFTRLQGGVEVELESAFETLIPTLCVCVCVRACVLEAIVPCVRVGELWELLLGSGEH